MFVCLTISLRPYATPSSTLWERFRFSSDAFQIFLKKKICLFLKVLLFYLKETGLRSSCEGCPAEKTSPKADVRTEAFIRIKKQSILAFRQGLVYEIKDY